MIATNESATIQRRFIIARLSEFKHRSAKGLLLGAMGVGTFDNLAREIAFLCVDQPLQALVCHPSRVNLVDDEGGAIRSNHRNSVIRRRHAGHSLWEADFFHFGYSSLEWL